MCVHPCRSALCVEVYLKMDRPDKAEQQAKVRLSLAMASPMLLTRSDEYSMVG